MEGLPKVKVINQKDGWLGTEVFIDGEKVDRVRSIDFHVGAGEVPSFTLETVGLPDIEMSAIPQFSFAPQTVQEAVEVLKNELRTNTNSKKILKDTVEKVLKEIPEEIWLSDLAELIVKTIAEK